MESIRELTNNIYFALIFGSIFSAFIMIYSRDKTIFKINKNSNKLKAIGVVIFVSILTFFISLMGFDVSNTRQALLVSFGIMSFISNSNSEEFNKLIGD